VREYVAQLGDGLRGKPGDWKVTEKVMIGAAISVLPTAQKPEETTWRTAEAQRELRQLYKQQSELRRMVRPNTKIDDQARQRVNLERKRVQRNIKKCIKRHKDIYRLQLSNMVVRGDSQAAAQAAMSLLGKGYDLGLVRGKEAKAPVVPQVFAAHFEQLFSKISEKETLGLTAEKVGPKSEPMVELSGAPTYLEVKTAVGKLSVGTAPERNGLRPEMYKMGGPVLVRRLVKDFAALWPGEEDDGSGSQEACAQVSGSSGRWC
jgi:hypothetical protein